MHHGRPESVRQARSRTPTQDWHRHRHRRGHRRRARRGDAQPCGGHSPGHRHRHRNGCRRRQERQAGPQVTPVAAASDWRAKLKSEWLLLLFAALALALALLDPQPAASYRRWLQIPTLAGLLGLLVAIQGIRDSGLVQHAAGALVTRVHTLRGLGLLLAASTALLAMVLTNDVSLFLIVPLTLAIGAISNLPVARMVVLEALAVNAGSTLSPIGNPQNLLLWQHAQLPFLHFTLAMLPTAVVMFALVALLALV